MGFEGELIFWRVGEGGREVGLGESLWFLMVLCFFVRVLFIIWVLWIVSIFGVFLEFVEVLNFLCVVFFVVSLFWRVL